jgi:IS30 family transposase
MKQDVTDYMKYLKRKCPVGVDQNRQCWPKITDFKKISQKEVSSVIVELNNRPRKKLNYQTPSKLMDKNMAALAV